MEWTIINKNLISNSKGEEFAVGLQWKPPFTEKSKLRRKLAFSRIISKEEIKHGARLEVRSNGTAQLAVADPALDKKMSLAGALGQRNLANSTIFMRISQNDYWVLSLTADNAIELSSDKLFDFFGARDYIEERLALQGDSAVRVINIGEQVSFDASSFEDKVELIAFEELVSSKPAENAFISEISSSLATRLLVGAYGGAALVLGAGYLYATHESEQYVALKSGEYSQSYNASVAGLNQNYKKIISSGKRKRMDMEGFINEGRSQYNNNVLTRKYSNKDVFKHLRNIEHVMPRNLEGWKFTGIDYYRQTFEVTFERQYGAQQALNYKAFSDALISSLGNDNGFTASFSRIEKQGDIAVIEIAPSVEENLQLVEFLDQNRLIGEKRAKLSYDISNELKKLGFSSQEIVDIESSITMLGVFEKKDADLLNRIAGRIEAVADKERDRITKVKKMLKEYSGITDIDIPKHEHTILPEGGAEDEIYPILQDTIGIEWSGLQNGVGFPVGIDDMTFKGKKILNEKSMTIKFTRSLWHSELLDDLLDKQTVTIMSLKYRAKGFPATLDMTISMIEANEAFIKLEKKLN